MKSINILTYTLLSFLIFSCSKEKKLMSIAFKNSSQTYHIGESIDFELIKESNQKIDSILITFQKKTTTTTSNKVSIPSLKRLLGKHSLKIEIYSNTEVQLLNPKITILNNVVPKIYNYKIIKSYPHQTSDYTQGLEFKGESLYESAGKTGESRLLEKNLQTGETIKKHILANTFFAEGLTIVGNKIHQLTWKGDLGFTYDLATFKQLGTFAYNNSKQGWGLCYDGKNTIYKSDGTTKIWKLNAITLKEEGFIQIATNKALKSKFNELEWIDGKIYANTWQKDSIAIINPENGAIEAIINLKGIRKEVGINNNDRDKVLNGIAYKKDTKQLYITGKYWPKLFEIEVLK